MSTKSSRAADALFKKQDKQAAMNEYQRRLQAEDEKSAKLKALRLAKEAEDRAAAEAAAQEKAAKKPTTKRKVAAKANA